MINGSGESGNDAFAFFSGLFCQSSLSTGLFLLFLTCFFTTNLMACWWLWVAFLAHNHFFTAE